MALTIKRRSSARSTAWRNSSRARAVPGPPATKSELTAAKTPDAHHGHLFSAPAPRQRHHLVHGGHGQLPHGDGVQRRHCKALCYWLVELGSKPGKGRGGLDNWFASKTKHSPCRGLHPGPCPSRTPTGPVRQTTRARAPEAGRAGPATAPRGTACCAADGTAPCPDPPIGSRAGLDASSPGRARTGRVSMPAGSHPALQCRMAALIWTVVLPDQIELPVPQQTQVGEAWCFCNQLLSSRKAISRARGAMEPIPCPQV